MIYNILVTTTTYSETVSVDNNLVANPVLTLVVKNTQSSTTEVISKEVSYSLNGTTGKYELSIVLSESEISSFTNSIYYYSVSSPTESILAGGVIIGTPAINTTDKTIESVYLIKNGESVYVMINNLMQPNTDYELTSSYEYEIDGNTFLNTQVMSFSSDYSPQFCTLSSVKDLITLYGITISDSLIYKTIRDNSEAIQTLTTRTDIDDWTAELPHEFGEYIKNKTIYDLVLNSYVNSSISSGSTKALGELSISNKADSAVYDLLNTLKSNLQPWYDMAMGTGVTGKAGMAAVVRASGGTKGFTYPYDRGIV